jgi:hypothetical protein
MSDDTSESGDGEETSADPKPNLTVYDGEIRQNSRDADSSNGDGSEDSE